MQQIVVHSSDFCLIAAGSPSTCPSARGSRQITSRAATSNFTARRSSSTSWSVAWLAAPDAGVSHPAFVCLPVLRRGQARRDAASCEQGIHGARGRLALVCGEGPHSGRHPARAVCDRARTLERRSPVASRRRSATIRTQWPRFRPSWRGQCGQAPPSPIHSTGSTLHTTTLCPLDHRRTALR